MNIASSAKNTCGSKRGEETLQCMISVDACLFDDQDDDYDVEITLQNGISSTSSSSAFNAESTLRQHRKRSSNMADGSQKKRKNKKSQYPSTTFSENMFGMDMSLCPASFENETETVVTHTQLTTPSHERGSSSDTDYLQNLFSSNHCWNMLINISEPCGEHSTSRKHSNNPCNLGEAQCTDIDVQNLRKNFTEDIMSLFSFSKLSCGTDASLRSEEHNYTSTLNHRESIVQNRCARSNAQRERVQRLRRKWHAPLGVDSHYHHAAISPVHRSLDDAEIIQEGKHLKESLYYDSDPELPVANRKEPTRAGKTYLWPIDTSASFESTGFGPCPPTPTAMRRVNALSFESHSPVTTNTSSADTVKGEHLSFDLWNDNEVKELVKELTAGQINLLWHPKESDMTRDEGVSPTCVVAWFENGVGVSSAIIQPKFMWRETYRVGLRSRKRNLASIFLYSLDLLSMVRILEPTHLDREVYPYVRSHLAFVINCCDGKSYLFEAENTRERDWFVCNLKLMVARFASMVFSKDDTLFSEFFTPFAHPLEQSIF